MTKRKNIKQIIEMHNTVDSIEKSIMDIDYCLAKNEDLDRQIKSIYNCLQNIKGMIVNDEIVYRENK